MNDPREPRDAAADAHDRALDEVADDELMQLALAAFQAQREAAAAQATVAEAVQEAAPVLVPPIPVDPLPEPEPIVLGPDLDSPAPSLDQAVDDAETAPPIAVVLPEPPPASEPEPERPSWMPPPPSPEPAPVAAPPPVPVPDAGDEEDGGGPGWIVPLVVILCIVLALLLVALLVVGLMMSSSGPPAASLPVLDLADVPVAAATATAAPVFALASPTVVPTIPARPTAAPALRDPALVAIPSGGLGLPRWVLDERLGPPLQGPDGTVLYREGGLIVPAAPGYVTRMDLVSPERAPWTVVQARSEVQDLLPADAVLLRAFTRDDGRLVDVWGSQSLASILPPPPADPALEAEGAGEGEAEGGPAAPVRELLVTFEAPPFFPDRVARVVLEVPDAGRA